MTAQWGPEQVVARLPYFVGYELGHDHVVAQLIGPTGRLGVTMAYSWPAYLDTATAGEDFAATIADIAQRDGTSTMLLAGYGPHARERLEAVADATSLMVDLDPPILAAVDLATGQCTLTLHGEPWHEAPRRLPDVRAEAVLDGLQTPASTRDSLTARVTPLASPTFAVPVPAAVAHAGDLEPSQRAEAAVRVLDLMAQTPHGSPPLNHGRDASAMSTLAVMMTSHRAVRDAVLVHAADDAARVDVLVRTFRAAPPEIRSPLAAAAGAALYLGGHQTALARAVLKHVDPTGPDARLADLVQTAAGVGLNPHHLADTLRSASTEGLQGADAQWNLARASATRAASFPTATASADHAAAAAPTARSGPAGTRATGQPGLSR